MHFLVFLLDTLPFIRIFSCALSLLSSASFLVYHLRKITNLLLYFYFFVDAFDGPCARFLKCSGNFGMYMDRFLSKFSSYLLNTLFTNFSLFFFQPCWCYLLWLCTNISYSVLLRVWSFYRVPACPPSFYLYSLSPSKVHDCRWPSGSLQWHALPIRRSLCCCGNCWSTAPEPNHYRNNHSRLLYD